MNDATQILNDLKKGSYSPVYFLQGDEPYYIDLISRFIEVNVIPKEQQGFNLTILYGNDVTVSDVLNNARRYPMMAERQVVLVKEAQNISDLNRENGQDQLIHYLEHPVPSTVLVFCHKNKTLDGRKALAKVMKKKSAFLDSKKIYDNQVPAWIEQYVTQRGFRVSPAARMMLSESIGNNLERLTNEIEKILINYIDPVEIDVDMVDKYVGISKEYNAFALQDAILKKDIVKAFKIVAYFAANTRQNPVIPTIAVLYSLFSKLLVVHAQIRRKEKVDLGSYGVRGYFLRDYQEAAQRYSVNQVVRNLHFIRMADLHCKGVGSQTSDGEELKELVAKLLY
ncbi:DNA polymerase III subunit delta [Fulvivirga sedimenti]|uniref:DNA polymerase III subunit delta n=1 Tax=Fulvivirga sedimenti TaxID=2879465 RepID=A0A9X1HMJ2_9BACT|nr:DNA polymerase III subunit delta [Fulvivirga sedimenti]MCA6073332.1 DNA polymerase III subunit delta [Fulvivirga sedimenti]